MTLTVQIPVRTVNPLNIGLGMSRGAAMAKAAAHRREKASARLHVMGALRHLGINPKELLPCVVTLTRKSPSKLDDDGAIACMKWIRDGVAGAIGVDDGSRFIRFRVRQRKCKRGEFGVECTIEKGVFLSDVRADRGLR